MGKGFHNFMSKKDFHPASFWNLKKVWEARQQQKLEEQRQAELKVMQEKEQDILNNKALLGDEKARLGLSFMYDAPAGINRDPEREAAERPEPKFEWQRKYNAPREEWAKGDSGWQELVNDQPFGIAVKHVRCLKCMVYGHTQNEKNMCPLYGMSGNKEDPGVKTTPSDILKEVREARNAKAANAKSAAGTSLGKIVECDDLEEWEEAPSVVPSVVDEPAKKAEEQKKSVDGKRDEHKRRRNDSPVADDRKDRKRGHKEDKGDRYDKKRHRNRSPSTSMDSEDGEVTEEPIIPLTTAEVQEEMSAEYGLKLKKNFVDSINADRAIHQIGSSAPLSEDQMMVQYLSTMSEKEKAKIFGEVYGSISKGAKKSKKKKHKKEKKAKKEIKEEIKEEACSPQRIARGGRRSREESSRHASHRSSHHDSSSRRSTYRNRSPSPVRRRRHDSSPSPPRRRR